MRNRYDDRDRGRGRDHDRYDRDPGRRRGWDIGSDYGRERLRATLNRPGFGEMGSDRDYDDPGDRGYSEDYGRYGYGATYRGGSRDREYDQGQGRRYDRYGGGYDPDSERPGRASDYRGGYRPSDQEISRGRARYGSDEMTGRRDYAGRYGGHESDYTAGGRSGERGYPENQERGWWERASDEVASWFGDDEAARRRRRDEVRRGGGMAGRGPKNYRRSDERVREEINDRLTEDDYVDASDIEVSVEDGVITLSGTVSSLLQKRRAAYIAERVSGTHDVLNEIRVRREAQTETRTVAQ